MEFAFEAFVKLNLRKCKEVLHNETVNNENEKSIETTDIKRAS